jgi:hypothetical protein
MTNQNGWFMLFNNISDYALLNKIKSLLASSYILHINCLFYHKYMYLKFQWLKISRFELTTSVVIGIDYIGSCKSNYNTITATTALRFENICAQGSMFKYVMYWNIVKQHKPTILVGHLFQELCIPCLYFFIFCLVVYLCIVIVTID